MSHFIIDHVPAQLVYGPVGSRRFGRSLGISCSPPGPVACRWHCPYCQLSEDRRGRLAPIEDILAAVERAVAACPAVDAVTVAGNGEPLDHPDFARVAEAAFSAARRLSARSVLLTNGDHVASWRDAVARFDVAYLKWDPGPREGAWRAMSTNEASQRRQTLRSQPRLRIQSMLSGEVDPDGDRERLGTWLEDLRSLRPVEVHLTTLERPPRDPRLRAAPAARLERWRSAAALALGVPVQAFPASAAEEPS